MEFKSMVTVEEKLAVFCRVLCRPRGLCYSYAILPAQHKGSQSPHVRNWSNHMLMNCELGMVVSAYGPALGKFKGLRGWQGGKSAAAQA